MRSVFFFGGIAVSAALFAFACSSNGIDNTEYGPPDSGQHPDANYCVVDQDCPPDNAGNDYACGFPIASACEARGVCVGVNSRNGACIMPNYCGCDGELVTTCPLADTSYVRGGPTNGNKPTTLADGGLSCSK
ncbi:MAG: hypothetical protein ABI183_16465 [Polyangiaceae bacterium]